MTTNQAPRSLNSLIQKLKNAEQAVLDAQAIVDDKKVTDPVAVKKAQLALARALAARGIMKTDSGADEEGLRDLLRSHALRYEYCSEAYDLASLLARFDMWEQEHYPGKAYDLRASPDWCPDAELGEALRVHARDTLLSMKPADNNTAARLKRTLISAIRSFERAQANCETISDMSLDPELVRKARAWIAAHRAACFTHFYFLRRSSIEQLEDATAEALFRSADAGFAIALEENAKYVWALKFKAFLLALRGGPRARGRMSDFRRARNMLRQVEDVLPNVTAQTSLLRSKAMLLSYDVGENQTCMREAKELASQWEAKEATSYREAKEATSYREAKEATSYREAKEATGYREAKEATGHREAKEATSYREAKEAANQREAKEVAADQARKDGVEAAEKSVAASLQAVRDDPEDFVAAYFGVLSTWFLSNNGGLSKSFYEAALPSALRSAKIRASNAFSQALAVLTGLEDLEHYLSHKKPEATVDTVPNSIFHRLLREQDFGLDWESRAIFIRDPLNQLLGSAANPLREQRDEIRRRFAVSPELTENIHNQI